MSDDQDVLTALVRGVADALQPLSEAIATSEGLVELLDDVGVNPTDQLTSDQLADLRSALADALAPLQTPSDLPAVVSGLSNFVGTFTSNLPPIVSDAAEYVVDALIVNLLRQKAPITTSVLLLLGIIQLEDLAPSRLNGRPRSRWAIHWERLPAFFQNPRDVFEERYGWGDTDFNPGALLRNLRTVLMFCGVPAAFQADDDIGVRGLSTVPMPILRVPLLVYEEGTSVVETGTALLPTRAGDDTRFDGLALAPFGVADLRARIDLGNDWSFGSTANVTALGGFGLILKDQGSVELRSFDGSDGSGFRIDLAIGVQRGSSQGPTVLFGQPGKSRLEAESVGVNANAQATSTGSVELGLEAYVQSGRLVIATAGSDSFISRILPSSGVEAPFELLIGWSTLRGVYFRGSAGLEVAIPIHLSLGPLSISTVHVGATLRTDPPAIDVYLGIDASAAVGPVAATLTRVGVRGNISVSRTPDFSFAFLPPTGAGLSVTAGPVSGGGFMRHDEARGSYDGILDLKFGDIGLVAVALITTKLPGGRQGYALFINIGVTFNPPITLPYNFNLQGCGGLLAINRTMDVEALRSGLRNRTLDSILFPEDPILNANKIITDSERVFPVEEGRFVVGPMAKLGWGQNGLITADIAIVLELPSPIVIALLGQLKARVPKSEEAKVRLNLDVLGVLDIAKKSLSFDASLYDSKILVYELYGDAALRLRWGSNPLFAMSVGGFHPKFTPPPKFPSLRRLTLALRSSNAFELSCSVYHALTSNSLQFGAKLRLHAEACGAALDGRLGFDTLFIFSPFEFDVGISGGVSASYKGHDIASVSLSFDLSGPTPWHAKGKAKVSVLCWDVTARFNKTWGSDDKARVAKVDPLDPFLREIALVDNWGAALLPRRSIVESLKSLQVPVAAAPDADTPPSVAPPDFLAHPAGMLEFRQRLLPLDMKLEKFANADVKDHTRFDVRMELGPDEDDSAPAADTEQMPAVTFEEVKEHFARGQFKDLKKSERLSKPSYERFRAGIRVGPSIARIDGAIQPCPLEYESIVTLRDGQRDQTTARQADWSRLLRTIGIGALRHGSMRHRRLGKFATGEPPRVGLKDEAYSVVDKVTLMRATDIHPLSSPPLNQTQAEDLLEEAIASNRAAAGSAIVVPEFEEVA